METWKSCVGEVEAVGTAPDDGMLAEVDILGDISSKGAFLAELDIVGTDLGDVEAA